MSMWFRRVWWRGGIVMRVWWRCRWGVRVRRGSWRMLVGMRGCCVCPGVRWLRVLWRGLVLCLMVRLLRWWRCGVSGRVFAGLCVMRRMVVVRTPVTGVAVPIRAGAMVVVRGWIWVRCGMWSCGRRIVWWGAPAIRG